MQINSLEITKIIEKRITEFKIQKKFYNEGEIISVIDGIIRIYGLCNAMQGEMLSLSKNKYAIALNLEKDIVGAVVLGSFRNIYEGMKVRCTGRILEVPVGDNFLGRVVNSLGVPIDGKELIKNDGYLPIENEAPKVIDREIINESIQTGYLSIDSMIPIGRGQRELIIGDRKTGKTSLAIDTIINQKNSGIKSIYVAIGQKMSTILNIVKILNEYDVLKNTIIVVASASDCAALQYLSPYSGCSMGEYFRNKGEDALIIYDDLSKHAISYRQISLLLKRPPGREAFPGDIFYLHSRLLERSSKVNTKYIQNFTNNIMGNQTGSLTALPIVETQSGDVSSFVPTNIISITDGQIFLESNLFYSGIRPAVNSGISVSRVGSSAQTQIIKKLSRGIRTTLAQYEELESFSQFSSDLDVFTKNQLIIGKKIVELLKQNQYQPLSIGEQALLLFSIEKNLLNDIKLKNISLFKDSLLFYIRKNFSSLLKNIHKKKIYTLKIKKKFYKIIQEFKNKIFQGDKKCDL
ncbi:F0F1 ATP synthase subunit alpha [Buchnera aphidicola]|uniref:F0F1 ATP synthase subunit alpha n=1 Tax=Buchnera aphidicola TaxID=9 RepID=UPI0022384A46|nr:F0F1 ATP synthase subunit alpha [Buchnera aphidicola]MCW5197417.1 F0F1 ATP synthase subunit alpha [Buchnera aphidicola (Chaitophorus viminalis)]